MEQLKSFTANAWGWIFLCGFVLAIVVFMVLLVLVERHRYKERRQFVKDEAERLARIMSIQERLRSGY